jgi:hypothetical protein
MTSAGHLVEMELGVLEVFAEFLTELLHRVVFGIVVPMNVDRGGVLSRGIELVHQHHDGLGARRVEIDQLEVEAAIPVAQPANIGIERAKDRPIKLRDVLGIGFASNFQVWVKSNETAGVREVAAMSSLSCMISILR